MRSALSLLTTVLALLVVWRVEVGASCTSIPPDNTCTFLHDAASDISPYRRLDATRSGGTYQTASTGTVTSPPGGGPGIQVTKGGVGLAWITDPLATITGGLSGTVQFNVYGSESPVSANAGPEVRIYKYSGGTETLIVASQRPVISVCQNNGTGCTEYTGSMTVYSWTATIPSTAINAGDRIVVKLYTNDAAALMNGGKTVTNLYDAPTVGSNGDTWVLFPHTLDAIPTPTPTRTLTRTSTATVTATPTPTVTETPVDTPDPNKPTPHPVTMMTDFSEGMLFPPWTQIGTGGSLSLDTGPTPPQWWLAIDVASGGTAAIEQSVASSQRHTIHLRVAMDELPVWTCLLDGVACNPDTWWNTGCTGAGNTCSVTNDVVVADTVAGTEPQSLVAIGADYRVRTFWHDLHRECSPNSLFKYTECDANSECPPDYVDGIQGNTGEASCDKSSFAVSAKLDPAVPHEIAVATTVDTAGARPYDVTLATSIDGGKARAATRWAGTCGGATGGTNSNGKACGAVSDCTTICSHLAGCSCTSCTCTSTIVGSANKVRLGTDIAAAKSFVARLRDFIYETSSQDPYMRFAKVVPLFPTGNSTANDWASNGPTSCTSNHAQCVDDTLVGLPDGDTTHLMTSAVNTAELWTLSDYAVQSGEVVLGAQAWVDAYMQTAGDTGTLDVGFYDVLPYEFSTQLTISDAYRQRVGAVMSAMPAGGAWNPSGLRGFIRYVGPGGTSHKMHVTDYVAQVAVAEPTPPAPNMLPDVNGDGILRLGIVGDSIMNETPLFDALNASAEDPDAILRCAFGGRTIKQVDDTWTATLNGAINGPCTPERGTNGKLDVAVLHIGANDFSKYEQETHAGFCMQRGCCHADGTACTIACTADADCAGQGLSNTCLDFHGPQQGGGCTLPYGTKTGKAGNNAAPAYCLAGVNVGVCCGGFGCPSPVACTGQPAGCVGGSGPGTSCTIGGAACPGGGTCTAWAAQPVAGQFSGNGDNNLLDPVYPATWCVPGGADQMNCPRGFCLHQTSTAYMTAITQHLIDVAKARTGGNQVRLVLAGNTDSCTQPVTGCIGGTNTGAACTVAGDCPGGVCRAPNAQTGWSSALADYRWYAGWLRATAQVQGLPFIDLGAYERRLSSVSHPDENVRDCIHQEADVGQPRMADLITACIERDTGIPENLCGDLGGLTCPTTLPATNTGTQTNLHDVFLASNNCTTPSSTEHVDGITVYVQNATAGTHLRASVYTVNDVTHQAEKVGGGACDAVGTLRGGAQWLTMPTTTPASCALAAGTTYFIGVIPESDSAVLVWATKALGVRFKAGVSYGGGMPATVTSVTTANTNYAFYLNVHTP